MAKSIFIRSNLSISRRAAEMKNNSQIQSNQPRLSILIVDDMPQVRRDLTLLLKLTGEFEMVGEAANGREAVEKTGQLNPDVILMDLEMPIMNGYQASNKIRTRWPDCIVIALSVHSGTQERQRARRCGVNAFIEKGAPLEIILKTIRQTRR
jgi:DNA-binding NarL/FixJ family response regulator